MAVIETSGCFDTDAVLRLLDEYERGYRQHDQHLAAIVAQSVLLIEDAARLYEEAERLRLDEAHCIMLRAAKDKLETENAKLRELVNSYANTFDRWAADNNGSGPWFSGEDWTGLANEMRVELAECCGELEGKVDE